VSTSRTAVGRLAGTRVALDGRYARRPGIGIHRYLSDVATLLGAEGAHVTLLANPPGAGDGVPGTDDCRVFGSRINVVWEQFDLPRHLRKTGYDLYWAPGNSGIPWSPVGPVTTVSTTHDLVQFRLPGMYLWRRPLYALPFLLWITAAVLRSDVLITGSEASAEDIRRWFRRTAVVVPSFIYGEPPPTSPGSLPDALTGRRYLVYNGGMDPRKNIGGLLRGFALAAARIPDIDLVLMGRGYEELTTVLEELGLSGRVHLAGFVTAADKHVILKAAAALVYPSLHEGFGLPILEAFEAGTPVITSDRGATAEAAGSAAILVDPSSASAIADGIVRALEPDAAERLRRDGLRRLADYDPVATRERLVDVLTAAIAR
jgi:glycosyltransferase involved in cell wall biosynthesis